MKQVISVRDIEEMLRAGKDVRALPEDALLTPSARDLLREIENHGRAAAPGGKGQESTPAPSTPRPSQQEGNGKQSLYASAATIESRRTASIIGQVTSRSPKNELEAFFQSEPIHELKLQICGRCNRARGEP